MLRRGDAGVRWARPAREIRGVVHGCNPAPGAWARRPATGVVKLWKVQDLPAPAGTDGVCPGTVLSDEGLVIAAGEGAVRVLEAQPENRARLDGETLRRGYRITAGEVWEDGI